MTQMTEFRVAMTFTSTCNVTIFHYKPKYTYNELAAISGPTVNSEPFIGTILSDVDLQDQKTLWKSRSDDISQWKQ